MAEDAHATHRGGMEADAAAPQACAPDTCAPAGPTGFADAVAMLCAPARLLGRRTVPLHRCVGRVLARDVIAAVALPPFDSAAMDGVAVPLQGRTHTVQAEWTLAGCAAAGAPAPATDAGPAAWEITTGACVPPHTGAVVPVERVCTLPPAGTDAPPRVRIPAGVAAGANIRRRGEDVSPGQPVLARGRALDAGVLPLLAALGIERVAVARRPRLGVLTTGRELAAPGRALPPGGIHDATSQYLAAVATLAGAQPVCTLRVDDSPRAFHAALDAATGHGVDLVLSTGAVSRGRHDFIPAALAERGAGVLFHGVAMRPGKPVLAAYLREGPHFIGLPGNPMATAAGFRFLVEPLLRAWLGMDREPLYQVPLATVCVARPALHTVLHGQLRCDGQGRLYAHPSADQASFRVLPFAGAPVWITLPRGHAQVPAGTPVTVHGPGHLRPPGWRPAMPA